MQDRIRNLEEFAQLSARLSSLMESSQRRLEENQRRMEEEQRARDDLLQQIMQSVAIMQADIVRIDETHA